MDLDTFRGIVDGTTPGIAICEDDLQQLYDYVGLQGGSSYSRTAVSDALYARIKACFTSGHTAVWRVCKSLRTDLIREHVLHAAPLDPYFEVLDHLQDAMRTPRDTKAPIEGEWGRAIQSAVDHVRIQNWGDLRREMIHARDFTVARAAYYLRNEGFAIRLTPGWLSLEEAAETALIETIEDLVKTIGGINVARRIFDEISPYYDIDQERYHVVQQTSMTGGGFPQMPWGYLIQLAVKHVRGRKPYSNTDAIWNRLCDLARAYAAVIDVQPYTPTFWGTMDATALVPYLQELAVYDTLFRIPQMRPSDVVKVARGMFSWLSMSEQAKLGWSIDQVLDIVRYLLNSVRDVRGPIFIEEANILRACPNIPREIVKKILHEVLSHPVNGANQNFSRPTDAPIPENPALKSAGHDFFLRPLLQVGQNFVLIDRSVCAPACIEALLTALRPQTEEMDGKVGSAIVRFLMAEFVLHGVPTCGGDYDAGGQHGECDLVVEAADIVIFVEVKKKSLTRPARAGSDAHLLLDLADSLLAAQAQTGWHEVRLRRDGHLDLLLNGSTSHLALNGREVERVAVSLFDFSSFQDRMLLKQFLEATLSVSFTSSAASFHKKFDKMNEMLVDIREQVAALHPGEEKLRQPFFNCWFISVPQILVLLDGVTDGAGFRDALWSCRAIVTGSSDLYYDLSRMSRSKRKAATPAT